MCPDWKHARVRKILVESQDDLALPLCSREDNFVGSTNEVHRVHMKDTPVFAQSAEKPDGILRNVLVEQERESQMPRLGRNDLLLVDDTSGILQCCIDVLAM